jgi:DNA-binding Lrp family transcriptional regulator
MTTIDPHDLKILRKLEWRGRVEPAEIGKTVGLPKAAVVKRIARLEEEGVLKSISLSLFPPPILGGEWKWVETSLVTKGETQKILEQVKGKVTYFSEAMIHTSLPNGVLPDLVILYYTQDPKSDLKTLRSLPGIEYAESSLLKTYDYPIPVELSKEEWKVIQCLQEDVRQNSDGMAELLGKEKRWIETKLERLLWTEDNRKGVFLALPSFAYKQITNLSHFHVSLESRKGFNRKKFESSLNGSGILPLPTETGFRGSDLVVESDVWGLMDFERKLEILRRNPEVLLLGIIIFQENIAEQPWLRSFIEERLKG